MDKDVRRTDRGMDFFAGSQNDNVARLRHLLLSYVMYNFDLGYCQVAPPPPLLSCWTCTAM